MGDLFRPTIRSLLIVGVGLAVPAVSEVPAVKTQPRPPDVGISGYVLGADGMPVASGSVVLHTPGGRATTTAIERSGRFRVVPDSQGQYQLLVSATAFTPYRINVAVPASRTVKLPVIQLRPPTYFQARFLDPDGNPITAPRLRRQFFDASGAAIRMVTAPVADIVDAEGTITIGPLPLGIMMLAIDNPPLAQMRLPDRRVDGAEPLLDGGTITVQAGAELHVDIVDAKGAPVPNHAVFLEEARAMAPLGFPTGRTNQQGRVVFDRVGPGRYRIRTPALGRCAFQPLMLARAVTASGPGTLYTRVVVGGTARFRVTSPVGPMTGMPVTVSIETGASPAPLPVVRHLPGSIRLVRADPACSGTTDADGRLTIPNFPPGAARVSVQRPYSTYVRRVNVSDGREIAIVIPDGLLPIRVTSARNNQPLRAAVVSWTGGGAQVEGETTATGDGLLEGVATTGGTLTVTATGHDRFEAQLTEPPGSTYEVVLSPAAPDRRHVRVVSTSGAPIPDAVVVLVATSPLEGDRVATTDAKGSVAFANVPPAGARLVSYAGGFVPAVASLADNESADILLSMTRGYRAVVNVELPQTGEQLIVGVANDAGQPVDQWLDSASDRVIRSPGRITVGALPPGAYVITLRGERGTWQHLVQIVDRDVVFTVP